LTEHSKNPLVIDIDDTLLRTDMLLESFLAALSKDAIGTLKILRECIHNKALLKHKLANFSQLDVSRLPVNEAVLELVKDAQTEGRDVVLASGSDQSLVDKLAERLALDGNHIGSDTKTNLTGHAKGDALVELAPGPLKTC